MSKHTPGPWVVEKDGFSLAMGGQVVATAIAPDRASINEQRANASLISAAPDLLAACYAAMGAIIGLGLENTEKRIREAIAKAEGETE